MTTHLTPDEFVTALEGAADTRVTTHLSACAACREELAALGRDLATVASVEVPEPSPLFWDHFGRRVREATTDTPVPAWSWWSPGRLVWTVGTAAAAVVLVVGLIVRGSMAPEPSPAEAATTTAEAIPVVEFDDLAGLFDDMAADDLDVFAPTGATTWAMVDDLTDVERDVFVRLVQRELEGLP